MRTGIIIVLLIGVCLAASSQHYVGMSTDEIIAAMKQEHGDFIRQKNVINKTFKYLKYVDLLEQRTILFFLNEGDTCIYVKYMLDYEFLDVYRDYYDKHYRSIDHHEWVDVGRGTIQHIRLREEDWFFTLLIEPANHNR